MGAKCTANCKAPGKKQRQVCNACEKLAEKAEICPVNLSASEGLLTFLPIYVNVCFKVEGQERKKAELLLICLLF
jgi:hypothetical protein